MARWGFFIRVILIVLAFFLAYTSFVPFAGDISFQTNNASFLSGVVHGILAPVSLVLWFFSDFRVFEVNSGWWYTFGFVISVLYIWGGSGKSTKSVVKNYYKMPHSEKAKESKSKLSDEDHERIGKVIEEKILAKLSHKKKKSDFKETDVSDIKVSKKKKKK